MPSVADHYVVQFQNGNVDPHNYQLVDVDFEASGPPPTLAQQGAAVIAYFAACGAAMMAADTVIVSVDYTPAGAPGSTPLPFPVTEYGLLHAAFPSALPVMTAYGVDIGAAASNLSPLGTSISVSEHTATAGPTGRGRHFLPFANKPCCTAGGFVDPTTLAAIKSFWDRFIGNVLGGLPWAVQQTPVVVNAARTTTKEILLVKPQPIFSNLESRRR